MKRVDGNNDGSLTRTELIKRLRKDEDLVSLLNLPTHVGDGDRGAFEAVFQGCDILRLSLALLRTLQPSRRTIRSRISISSFCTLYASNLALNESCADWGHSMDTNDDRVVDLREFITFFARRHVDGGWLNRDEDAAREVLALTDDTLEESQATATNAANSLTSTPALTDVALESHNGSTSGQDEKPAQGEKTKPKSKKKKKR